MPHTASQQRAANTIEEKFIAVERAILSQFKTEAPELYKSAIVWIKDGWNLDMTPSGEMIAAALLHEARDQDSMVALGESDASFPVTLRAWARKIIDTIHPPSPEKV